MFDPTSKQTASQPMPNQVTLNRRDEKEGCDTCLYTQQREDVMK